MKIISSQKQLLREKILQKRLKMPLNLMEELSRKIARNFFELNLVKAEMTVALYWSFRSEVSTKELFVWLQKNKVRVLLPKVSEDRLRLDFYLTSSEADLKIGRFEIKEPDSSLPRISISKINLVVLPGVAFDQQGNRLGWGRGHYDRVLENCSAIKVGLAYDFQVLSAIPTEKHDQKVDYLITESNLLKC